MTGKEIFVTGTRLIGIWFAMETFPAVISLNYAVAAQFVAALILLTRADQIAAWLYPQPRQLDTGLDRPPRDFRDA